VVWLETPRGGVAGRSFVAVLATKRPMSGNGGSTDHEKCRGSEKNPRHLYPAADPMTSERPARGLGERLRVTAHEPEDAAAAQLRARLRHKMFDIRTPQPPREVPADVRLEPPMRVPPLGWIIPALAVLSLVAIAASRRTRAQPAPSLTALLSSPLEVPRPPQPPPEVLDEGPALLEAAMRLSDGAREAASTSALAAPWAEPGADERIEATVELSAAWRTRGDLPRAIALLRDVLDDLGRRAPASPARVTLLTELALVYDAMPRPRAASSVRAEARRLRDG